MLKENGIPYLRPDDYLAEMMKDDKKMKMIEKRKETIEEEKKQKADGFFHENTSLRIVASEMGGAPAV